MSEPTPAPAPPPKVPTVLELQQAVTGLLGLLCALYGPRASAILMVGIPIPDSGHDRFAANYFGPCLSARGLLAWGETEVRRLIDAGDTSKNGQPHP